ncbi:MAG: wax ester/triacylglycerol synthase domain-containing protein [Ilumatobacteraceae bacterium]
MGSTYLSQNDTIMWMVEADPLLRSTITGVVLLDGAPDWERLRTRVAGVTNHVPALREKVVPVPLHPTTLQWEHDHDFDLDYHLRRIVLPEGGGVQDLLDWARTQAMGGFDSTRPLWEFTLVEGVDGERAAFVMKAHHVVTDGIGAVQLAAHLYDFEPDAPSQAPSPSVTPHRLGSSNRMRDVVVHDVAGVADFARQGLASVVPNLLHAVRHPQQAATEVVETVMSVGRFLAPAVTPRSGVMVGRMTSANYRTLEVPTEALRAAAKRSGGRLNDAFLAGITAGLRHYHLHHGEDIHELRVAMPISQRQAAHDEGGNHVTIVRFVLPVDAPTPDERIREMHDVVQGVRAEKALDHTEAIAGFLNLMPTGVLGSMLRGVDFLASNVPGVPVPMWLEGRKVERFFPFGPTAGSALNVTLMSYDGTCCIGINADAAAVPDPDVLADCMRTGFAEVCASPPG